MFWTLKKLHSTNEITLMLWFFFRSQTKQSMGKIIKLFKLILQSWKTSTNSACELSQCPIKSGNSIFKTRPKKQMTVIVIYKFIIKRTVKTRMRYRYHITKASLINLEMYQTDHWLMFNKSRNNDKLSSHNLWPVT